MKLWFWILVLVTALGTAAWLWIETPWKGEPTSEKPATELCDPKASKNSGNKNCIEAKAAKVRPSAEALAKMTPQDRAWALLEADATEAVIGHDVFLNVTEKQHKTWEVLVKTVIYDETNKHMHLKTLEGDFFNPQGQPTAHFTAPYGEYEQSSQKLRIFGGMHLIAKAQGGKPGVKVTAPELLWNKAEEKWMTAQGGLIMDLGGLGTTKASKGRFATDFSVIQLLGGAETTLQTIGKANDMFKP